MNGLNNVGFLLDIDYFNPIESCTSKSALPDVLDVEWLIELDVVVPRDGVVKWKIRFLFWMKRSKLLK